MEESIKKILEAGAQAPSGSNSQPWRFRVRDNQIDVIAFPEKDHPILNFRYRGTWFAHGALLENILIAASALGYNAQFDLFPDKSNSNLTARITLERGSLKDELLYKYIFKRTTNRKPYANTPLTSEQRADLLRSVREVGGGEVKLIEDLNKLKILGEALSANEVVMLENKFLHKLFFEEIVWTGEEEKKRKSGLYLKTMELKPPQQFALRFFKYWPVVNFLNKLGLAKSIAKENAGVYSSAAAIGILIVDDDDVAFLQAGRIVERLWLKVTKMNLSFHLLTGIPFLWQGIRAGKAEYFSREHVGLIEDAYKKIVGIGGATAGRIAAFLFRIGDGGEPSARSSKMAVDNLLI